MSDPKPTAQHRDKAHALRPARQLVADGFKALCDAHSDTCLCGRVLAIIEARDREHAALGTAPQGGTGSEYERGRADGRRLTLEAAQLALVASGFDAFGPLYRRIEDRAELPTDAPQEPTK